MSDETSIISAWCWAWPIYLIFNWFYYTPRTTKLLRDILVSLRPSVRLSVRLSRLPCPLCNIYSSGWILSILATNDHYHERVCRTQCPLTLTYIFKVIWPCLRKSCLLCSVYSSGWIFFNIWHERLLSFGYTLRQRSCWGGYWFHSVRSSVRRASVRPSVCPACRVRSVTSTVLDGLFPY